MGQHGLLMVAKEAATIKMKWLNGASTHWSNTWASVDLVETPPSTFIAHAGPLWCGGKTATKTNLRNPHFHFLPVYHCGPLQAIPPLPKGDGLQWLIMGYNVDEPFIITTTWSCAEYGIASLVIHSAIDDFFITKYYLVLSLFFSILYYL